MCIKDTKDFFIISEILIRQPQVAEIKPGHRGIKGTDSDSANKTPHQN